MNKKTVEINTDYPSTKIELNSSSRLIGAEINKETGEFKVEYFESPFEDQKDVYHFASVATSELDLMNDYQGYTFYGMFYDKRIDEYLYLFGKQVDRVPQKQ